MNKNKAILECVPNISYAEKDEALASLIASVTNVEGQQLLDVDVNRSANRSVLTFAGEPEAVVAAAFSLFKTAAELIDMRLHKGVHPRVGAVDVCPLVPLRNCTVKDAIYWADVLALMVGRHLNIPVYLYEYSARKSFRRSLPAIRKGGYEGLSMKLRDNKWQPDYGHTSLLPDVLKKSGASVIGARNILVACNISLTTRDKTIAQKIARVIRSIGYKGRPGMFKNLRAMGWYMEDFQNAQVSMNLLNYKKTSLLEVWNAVKKLAGDYGCGVIGLEVIGLIPEQCVLEAGAYQISLTTAPSILLPREMRIAAGIEYLGLNKIKPFDPERKILEYALRNAGL